MAKKQSRPQLSSVIEGFINTVEEAQRDYDWNYEEVNRLNLLQQDLLHTSFPLSGHGLPVQCPLMSFLHPYHAP